MNSVACNVLTCKGRVFGMPERHGPAFYRQPRVLHIYCSGYRCRFVTLALKKRKRKSNKNLRWPDLRRC